MNNMIQIERFRYAKICRERTSFHDLINNCPGKSENRNYKGHCASFSSSVFLSEASRPKLSSKVAVLKVRKIPLEKPRWISVLVAKHSPSYLQKMNCAVCCS